MNCAGYVRSNSSFEPGACGYASWPNGIEPASYQQSMTSGTRVAVAPQPATGHANVTSSTYGRCGSRPERSRPVYVDSSASDSTQVRCPPPEPVSSHRQMGSGVPQ